MRENIIAILVTYNPEIGVLSSCISSICAQVTKVVIIDNASSNVSEMSALIAKYDNVFIDLLSENIGLASAQNKAITISKQFKASRVILFDQDSVIEDGFISKLVVAEKELIKGNKLVAAIGPSFFDPVSGKTYPATIYRGPLIERVRLSDKPIEATFIIASGCLIRTEVLDDIGLMLDELFIDYIDVEWSLRARSKGYSVFIAPQARMAHTIGDRRLSILGRTISVHSPLRRYYLVRNSFLMLRLGYVPFGYKLRESFFNVIRTFIGFLTAENKTIFCKYFLMAFRDGLLGRSGPCPKIYKS
ncbi:rhamnosyltransferase [Aeromonas lusitana]|uniref:Rhamnosyltransferase n=1 Tax=Aeromonas lusitana TaxID=931529 RepID=A0A2M8HA78_9GAMM|nr:rhamnosyltransferase [Aeromonas lusitana]PJC93492.1 rhamnosyltransferase [Aeromonas lusitana]